MADKTAFDPGKPADALNAFLSAAVTWPNGTDPNISTAFELGWRVNMAATWASSGRGEWATGTPGLADTAQAKAIVDQINHTLRDLTASASPTPAADPKTNGATGASPSPPAPGEGDPAVALQTPPAADPATIADGQIQVSPEQVLTVLYAKDGLLGKAAYLGIRLRGLCWAADPAPLDAAALVEIKALLLTLATKLPDNAAHAVLNSLALYEEGYAQQPVPTDQLRRQGEIWRGFLSGDVAPKDVLHVTDYVGTADLLAGSIRDLLVAALRGRLKWLLLIAAVLAAGGVALVLLLHNDTAGALSGATSLLAALGLSWKGIGQFFGTPAAKAEQALWESQLDWTIAYRATIGSQTAAAAGKPATNARARDHVQIWKQWNANWPSTNFEYEQRTSLPSG
jgi:hypothetical protein